VIEQREEGDTPKFADGYCGVKRVLWLKNNAINTEMLKESKPSH